MRLTAAQAHGIMLYRHGLLERVPPDRMVALVGELCGLQAQVPTVPAQALWARVRGLPAAAVDQAVAGRELVRTWTVRGTRHLVRAADLAVLTAVERRRRPPRPDLEAQVLDLLDGGPRTRSELADLAVQRLGWAPARAAELFGQWGGILRTMALRGLIVDAGPAAGGEVAFARTDRWLPQPPAPGDPADEGARLLVQYLRGYGPATLADFAYWAGMRMSEARAAWERARERLAAVEVEGVRGTAWLPASDAAAVAGLVPALPGADGRGLPPRLLPAFDVLLLGRRDKGALVDPAVAPHIFKPGAWVAPAILAGGRVAGPWRMERRAGGLTVHLQPLLPVAPADLEHLRAEAEGLAAFLGLPLAAFAVERFEGAAPPADAARARRDQRLLAAAAALQAEPLPPPVEAARGFSAYLEPLRGRWLAHIPALPGCAAEGPGPEQALAAAPAVIAAHLAWRARAGLPAPAAPPAAIAAAVIPADLPAAARPLAPRGGGTFAAATLPPDLHPLPEAEWQEHLAALERYRSAAVDLARRIPPAALEWRADPAAPSPGGLLDRLTQGLGWYRSRCLAAIRTTGDGPAARLEYVSGQLTGGLRGIAAGRSAAARIAGGEVWTSRKVVRLAALWTAEHLAALEGALAAFSATASGESRA